MIDSYATGLKVHHDTAERYKQPVPKGQQRVEIPSHWFGSRSGGYRMVVRTIHVRGTVETEHYVRQRVEFGTCVYGKLMLVVVQNGTTWKAVEKKGEN